MGRSHKLHTPGQCRLLSPQIIVIFITDLTKNIKSSIQIFADDTEVSKKVKMNKVGKLRRTLKLWTNGWKTGNSILIRASANANIWLGTIRNMCTP